MSVFINSSNLLNEYHFTPDGLITSSDMSMASGSDTASKVGETSDHSNEHTNSSECGTTANVNEMFRDIRRILIRPQPFADSDAFVRGEETFKWLRESCKVLVVGAGGLGCEILKSLCLSGFTDIHVIDMDIIDITNLNRQFLFRESDVGRPKATAAADLLNNRFRHLGIKVTDHVARIECLERHFYQEFNQIIAGLDNIESRRWLNSLLHSFIKRDAVTNEVIMSTTTPFFDGGTEGLKGQARVVLPGITSCFECSLESFPDKVNYPLCTIAETPRLPEHCIVHAMLISWEKTFGDRTINSDIDEDVSWVYNTAKARAEQFGIRGVTYSLALGVLKRVVPAVASTNALIAASLVNEAFKFATYCNPPLCNYLMYMGDNGVYTLTFEYTPKEGCLVCGKESELKLVCSSTDTLQQVIDRLCEPTTHQLKKPSLTGRNVVFMQNPPSLRRLHEAKLTMTLDTLIRDDIFQENEALAVTDPTLAGIKMVLRISLTK